MLQNGLHFFGGLVAFDLHHAFAVVDEYAFVDEAEPDHFAQQSLVLGVHLICAAYLLGLCAAEVLEDGLLVAYFGHDFEYVGDVVVAVAVADDGLYEVLSVGLEVHLLQEVAGQVDALLDVGAQLYLDDEGIAVVQLQHLVLLQGNQALQLPRADIQRLLVV
jgi:hypothetical protein